MFDSKLNTFNGKIVGHQTVIGVVAKDKKFW